MAYLGSNLQFGDPTRTTAPQMDAERFSGNGSTVSFTLSRTVSFPTDIRVVVENVLQEPTVSYNVLGTTLTFTEAPPSGTFNIYVVYLRSNSDAQVTLPDGSVTYAKLANNIRIFTSDNLTPNGNNAVFTLTEQPADANTVFVTVDGVVQRAPIHYTVSGKTITFSSNPPALSNVHVRHLGFRTTTTVTTLAANSTLTQVNMVGQTNITGDLTVTGTPTFTNSFDKIFSITASVASNALTVTLNPCALDFRSSTLTSGTIVTRTVTSAISVTVSSGSTLGTASAQQSRIVVLAIDNAGTVELAVVNISGGSQLDETNLITTTAEGGAGAADSASTIYSTTARTSVAYRVVGYVESTQATAGTWATAPSTIQGKGGQALSAMSSLGYGQTWQDVAASRAVGTTYTNTTGRPIQVQVTSYSGVGNNTARLTINGIIVSSFKDNDYYTASAVTPHNVTNMGIVPPGGTYSITNGTSGTTIAYWAELR